MYVHTFTDVCWVVCFHGTVHAVGYIHLCLYLLSVFIHFIIQKKRRKRNENFELPDRNRKRKKDSVYEYGSNEEEDEN
jgi:hypothetical protein